VRGFECLHYCLTQAPIERLDPNDGSIGKVLKKRLARLLPALKGRQLLIVDREQSAKLSKVALGVKPVVMNEGAARARRRRRTR
jgi:hypothetical protein